MAASKNAVVLGYTIAFRTAHCKSSLLTLRAIYKSFQRTPEYTTSVRFTLSLTKVIHLYGSLLLFNMAYCGCLVGWCDCFRGTIRCWWMGTQAVNLRDMVERICIYRYNYTRNVYHKQDETVLIIEAFSHRLTSESELSWCSGSWICGPNLTLGLCKDMINSWGGQFQCGQTPITRQSVNKYTHSLWKFSLLPKHVTSYSTSMATI